MFPHYAVSEVISEKNLNFSKFFKIFIFLFKSDFVPE